MEVFSDKISFSTGGDGTVQDITGKVEQVLERSGVVDGLINIFVPGSTAAVTTVEYEPGLIRDLPEFFEKIIPSGVSYHHDKTWGDGNGFSHLRASLVGPSLTVPVSGAALVRGTWQQIVFLDFDNRARNRSVHITVTGNSPGGSD
ncbi:MAG: YjbQ family protein [Candidatus Latescibacteria bacterium]|nr:YjbQ family protein [bacterium]MBD3424421.1 YjbQ family protein [Candidatus Latescibacterota bacterium]